MRRSEYVWIARHLPFGPAVPAALTCAAILPFMVQSFYPDTPRDQLGRAAGVLASSFHVGGMLGAYVWGQLSDTYGRRAVMLAGITGLCTVVDPLVHSRRTVIHPIRLTPLHCRHAGVHPAVWLQSVVWLGRLCTLPVGAAQRSVISPRAITDRK